MPLESLRQPFDPEQAGHKLREVQVEHEPERESAAKKKFEELKNSPFHSEQGWLEIPGEPVPNPWDQFFGIMAEAEFDPANAKQEWERMKSKEVYLPEQKTWDWGTFEFSFRIEPKLISLLVQLSFEKEAALAEYQEVLQTMGGPQILDGKHDLSAARELLHVLIQAEMQPTQARERYQALKESLLYDSDSHLWHENYFMAFERPTEWHDTGILLLSFIVELRLGLSGVAERYEAAKQSELFDQKQELWQNGDAVDMVDQDWKYTRPQLLAVIVEARLEKMQGQQELATPTKLPEERNF